MLTHIDQYMLTLGVVAEPKKKKRKKKEREIHNKILQRTFLSGWEGVMEDRVDYDC